MTSNDTTSAGHIPTSTFTTNGTISSPTTNYWEVLVQTLTYDEGMSTVLRTLHPTDEKQYSEILTQDLSHPTAFATPHATKIGDTTGIKWIVVNIVVSISAVLIGFGIFIWIWIRRQRNVRKARNEPSRHYATDYNQYRLSESASNSRIGVKVELPGSLLLARTTQSVIKGELETSSNRHELEGSLA